MLTSQQLYQQAHQLPALEKLRLAELLLSDLDLPDAACDKAWAAEAQSRWQAYQAGKLATVSYDVVMEKYQ
jgi:putative addiction module component (TIGR02574 family)